MSHRSTQKREARAARLAAEAAARRREHLRRWALLAAVVAAATGAVALAVLLGGGGDRAVGTSAETSARYDGIPQQGVTLGDPDAPVVLEEFADLQCPFCRDYATATLPAIVREYVRTGKVRLVYRDLAFLGEDSQEAARFAAAAGEQRRLWQVIDRLYAAQGAENSGYVTEGFLRDAGGQVAGLDVARAERDQGAAAVTRRLDEARARARTFAIQATPAFVLRGPDGEERVLDVAPTDVDAFRAALDEALAAS